MESIWRAFPAVLSGNFGTTGGAVHANGAYLPYSPADSSGMANDDFQSTRQSLEPSEESWNPELQIICIIGIWKTT